MTLKTITENRMVLTQKEIETLELAHDILLEIADNVGLENFTLADEDGTEYNEEYANRAYNELTNFLENVKTWD